MLLFIIFHLSSPLFYYMSIRTNLSPDRTHSRFKSDQHRSLLSRIADLQHENKELRLEVLLLERRLL
jgi:hypothetical protein